MIKSEHPQLSEEWFKERAGLPTASNFDKIITSKDEPSKTPKGLYIHANDITKYINQNLFWHDKKKYGITKEVV